MMDVLNANANNHHRLELSFSFPIQLRLSALHICGMILFSLLIEKLNSWHSWHLGGSLYPAGSRYASTSPFYATPVFLFSS
ncbi:hypothetical protein [Fischerella thermalis]|uniref:hypothetical protein n=1 Tax=Fischerella thermalis TaxID=372787 RepID=UPI001F231369|nr:hypothetical protein [Fischerella thermalis]